MTNKGPKSITGYDPNGNVPYIERKTLDYFKDRIGDKYQNEINEEKIEAVLADLKAWLELGETDDSIAYAYRNGYRLHAASLWMGSGAMSEKGEKAAQGIRIDHEKEKAEIEQICNEAHIYICPSCNHHGFYDDDEGESIECQSCLETAHKSIPVVDGDSGSVDQYGKAHSEEEALRVAEAYFVDKPVEAYIAHDITLADGQKLDRAWVVVTA